MTAAPAAERRRADVGLGLGLLVILIVGSIDLVTPPRSFPLTSVLLGPLLASALAPVRRVVVVGITSVIAAFVLVTFERLPSTEGWTRIGLVTAAAVGSMLVAQVRTRHERDLAKADRVAGLTTALQQRLLPNLLSTSAVDVRAVYRPSTEDLMLAGDFVDVVPFPSAGPEAVAFCVGDVTGHDPAAAGLGAALRASWRTLALSGGDPADWLRTLDGFMRSEATDEKLATLCVGVLDPGTRRLLVANAGHPRPVMLTSTAAIVDIEIGPPLGLPADLKPEWQTDAVGLDSEFGLVLYTDGLVEGRRAPGSEHRYGEESLTAWLNEAIPAHCIEESHLERLVRDVEAANGGRLHDDVAIVVLAGRCVRPGAVETEGTPATEVSGRS